MGFAQFIHVAEFFETILCFSILILIGQRFIMTWRNLDQKYLQTQTQQYESQLRWERTMLNHKEIQNKGREDEMKRQTENKPEPPQPQTLKTSLVQNQHDQTDRKITPEGEQQKPVQRKSLTDLNRVQQRSSKQIQIKDDDSSRNSNLSNTRKDSGSQAIKKQQALQLKIEQIKKKHGFDDANNIEEPSLNSNPDGQHVSNYVSPDNGKIQLFGQIDTVFNEHLPILMSILILGIMVSSTYIFTMVCFFWYIFTNLLLKYREVVSKLRNESSQSSTLSRLTKLIPNLWIIAIFVSYWSDTQFS